MKFLLLFLTTSVLPVNMLAQSDQKGKRDEVLQQYDVNASFPGGEDALRDFLETGLNYPESARDMGIQMIVQVYFTVNKDGTISDVYVDETDSFGFAKEAIRLVTLMPPWQPATAKNEPVKQQLRLPIQFEMAEEAVELQFEEEDTSVEVMEEAIAPPEDLMTAEQPAVAEETEEEEPDNISIFKVKQFKSIELKPDLKPEYPEGIEAMMQTIEENVEIPYRYRWDLENQIPPSFVVLRFVVDTDGKLCNPEVLRSVNVVCDNEAFRVIDEYLSDFNPAVKKGQKVPAYIFIPVRMENSLNY